MCVHVYVCMCMCVCVCVCVYCIVLVRSGHWELSVLLIDWDGEKYGAYYDTFKVCVCAVVK